MSLKVGDWVKSHRAGIWQIYRVLEYKCQNPVTGLEQDAVTIFSKCFVTNKFKPSFKEQCCDPSLITPLSSSEKSEVNLFISQNEELYKKFREYEPSAIDCIYNARIKKPKAKEISVIEKNLSDLGLIRDLEINRHISSVGYAPESASSWTAQFVSENFSIVNGYIVFKFNKILAQ
ncbi:MAG: hypothetical protein LBE21_02750 [Pseudomonadales bacterium]|jgi:hypothetical protein|nr:hypothetical protein [Pseudomonadales bacterium]